MGNITGASRQKTADLQFFPKICNDKGASVNNSGGMGGIMGDFGKIPALHEKNSTRVPPGTSSIKQLSLIRIVKYNDSSGQCEAFLDMWCVVHVRPQKLVQNPERLKKFVCRGRKCQTLSPSHVFFLKHLLVPHV